MNKKEEKVIYCFKYGGNCKFCPKNNLCTIEDRQFDEKRKRLIIKNKRRKNFI